MVISILHLILAFLVKQSQAWTPAISRSPLAQSSSSSRRFSTPFEVGYYDDPSNPYDPSGKAYRKFPLACPPDTPLVLGLNKYSHDTAICAAHAGTGEVLFAISKERLTRKKHDAGNVASLVDACLESLQLNLDNIEKVVVNNHHHRVLMMESNRRHMEWESGLNMNNGAEGGYDDDENVLDHAEKIELSHHLAHAYSTATQSTFDKGLVVVMDGMGETFRAMLRAKCTNDPSYVSDLSFGDGDDFAFECIPSDLMEQSQISYFDWREAESVYQFQKKETTIDIWPVFKRFTQENSAPAMDNHGFENMDSVGALYSRASSHIFGDWNACGKVMGLAPWMTHSWEDGSIKPRKLLERILSGKIHVEKGEESLKINRDRLMGVPYISRMDPDLFDQEGHLIRQKRYDFDDDDYEPMIIEKEANDIRVLDDDNEEYTKRLPTKVALDAISLAYRMQIDLEDVVMNFVSHFKEKFGETNLCIAGGVGLNSVLNGRLSRELGFENTYISPYPGDDGIAVGCCAYALFGNESLDKKNNDGKTKSRPPIWKSPLSPYQGPMPTEMDIKEAIDAAASWLEVEAFRDEDCRIEQAVFEIKSGGIVAWYTGRSELGPRALGHRSILADPRKKQLVRFINQYTKNRESFRPFAPSVLAEHASEWFDLGDSSAETDVAAATTKSPYMSLTAMVHPDKQGRIPAVTHVDGSSRLQTVTRDANPLYYKLISKFFQSTGVPMVLNTSFNTIPGEPIVESPQDAIRSFLCSTGSVDMLVMGDYVIRRKKADLKSLLGEVSKDGQIIHRVPARPIRTGTVSIQTSIDAEAGEVKEESMIPKTRVRMSDRPMHNPKDGGWFDLMDEMETQLLTVCDGKTTLNDMMGFYTAVDKKESISKEKFEQSTVLVQNIIHRLINLYENTLIRW